MSHCDGCTGCTVDDKVVKIAKKFKDVDGGIMSALHEVQDEYGYISESVQKYLSKELSVPMSDIYGIITFYSRFSLVPKGKYNVQVCMGTACYVKGAEDVLKEFKDELKIDVGQVTEDGKFSLESVRCIGACGLAPAIVVNSEVYGKMSPDKVKEILSKYN
ncbi:MAG: NADH-quinone oxidoreductase, subunit [Clostridia bacterium]|jgi:NADP-reducing hydrogenase subunit HndA|nr:NADH-quinone oxidoreductase, subunit [Clostridia bacterium]